MFSAGMVRTATVAGPGPALAKWCTVPGGTRTVSPGPAISRRPPTRNLICPASTVKHSSCSGWAWLLGTRPPGASTSSHSSTPAGRIRRRADRDLLAAERVRR